MARRSASRKAGLKRLAVAGAAAVALAMFAPTAADAARVSNQVSSVAPHSLEATGQEGWRKRNKRGFFFLEGSAEHEHQGQADDASSGQQAMKMKAKQDGEDEGEPWDQPKEPVVPGPFYPWHDKDGKDGQGVVSATSDEPAAGDKKQSGLSEGWRKKKGGGGFFFLEGSGENRQEALADAEGDQESQAVTGESAGEAYPMQHPSSAAEITAGSASNEGRKFFKKGGRRD